MCNKQLWIFAYCAAVLCMSCGVMFGPDDGASGEYGTITLGAGGRAAAPSDSPFEFTAFSKYRLTVRRGSGVVVASVEVQAGGTPFVIAETGTGYTLEVYALVDQANQNNRSFAKSYKGVSAPFDLTAAGKSVEVSLSLYEAAPVEVEYTNSTSPYIIGGVSFFSDDFYGLNFDRYGRLLVGRAMSGNGNLGLYVVEKDEGFNSPMYELGFPGKNFAYNVMTNSVFTIDSSTFYSYDLAALANTGGGNIPVDISLNVPEINDGAFVQAFAFDSTGSMYYTLKITGNNQSMALIGKAAIFGQNLVPDLSFLPSPIPVAADFSNIMVKDIQAVMGRVVVVILDTGSTNSANMAQIRVIIYDAASSAKISETLLITAAARGGLHLITGWDEDGVWLYTEREGTGGNLSVGQRYYVTWNGTVTAQ